MGLLKASAATIIDTCGVGEAFTRAIFYTRIGFLDVEGDATTGATNGYEYVMYSIGGSYDIGMFTIDLNWTEAVNSADAVANQELSEAVVLSISSSW